MNKNIILKFNSGTSLWKFKMLINAVNVEINFRDCTLICDCSDEQVQIAAQQFQAEVAEEIVISHIY